MKSTQPLNLRAARRRTPWTAALATALVMLMAAPVAHAQVVCDPASPCSFDIESLEIQRVPAIFKFQARIAQAKLPVPEAIFKKLLVYLKDGNENLCEENFTDVRVRNSVLNLDIGWTMSCAIEDAIAQRNGLAFQVCIGGPENCLKPIALGTIPYAVKSSFAVQAQEAHKSDIAATSHYAQRATADRDLWSENQIGMGYVDFYTPAEASNLYPDAAEFAPYREGGFIQWTPVNQANPTLNICSKDLLTDEPTPLSELVLYAVDTTMRGNATAEGNLAVAGTSNLGGQVTMGQGATVAQDLGVGGESTLTGQVTMNTGAQVNKGLEITNTAPGVDLVCGGDAVFGAAGQINQTQLDVYSAVEFHGRVNINAELTGIPATSIKGYASASQPGHIASNTVDSWNIKNDTVTTYDIKNNTVTTSDIADTTIRGYTSSTNQGDIGSNTVDSWNIKNNTVTSSDIKDNTIVGADIVNGTITGADIGNKTVSGDNIADETIRGYKSSRTRGNIASNTVDSWNIRDATIKGYSSSDSRGDIAYNTVDTWNIKNNTITSTDLGLSVTEHGRHSSWGGHTDVQNKIFCAIRQKTYGGHCLVVRVSARHWRLFVYEDAGHGYCSMYCF